MSDHRWDAVISAVKEKREEKLRDVPLQTLFDALPSHCAEEVRDFLTELILREDVDIEHPEVLYE